MATRYLAAPQGNVFIANRDASGRTGGFVNIGDTEGVTINTSQQFLDVQESQSGLRNTVVHAPISSDYSVELTVLNVDGDNLARGFYGSSAAVVGASVTGEAITAYNGTMIELKYPGVSAVTVTKTSGSTPLVLGTDYTLDAEMGTITILPGSTLVPAGAGVPCTVNYTHGGLTAKIKAFTQGLKDYTIRVQAKSPVDGTISIYTFHRAALDMAATLQLISTGVNKLVLKGKLLPAAEITTAGESQYFLINQK